MNDLTKLLEEIQNTETSCVDMVKRRAKGTFQWFLENDHKTHPIHDNNHLEFFMCGQEGFASIQKDISKATSSIDLVLWGFDPGMELVREGNVWPRGTTYGDLLSAKALAGVKVRMLVWFAGDVPMLNIIASMTGNVPDIGPMSGVPMWSSSTKMNAPQPSDTNSSWTLGQRASYCREWWTKALHGAFPDLEVRLRTTHSDAIEATAKMYLPGSANSFTEKKGMEHVGTHHQKPILIDYAAANAPGKPRNTCGYVMGLNSVTDYWDTTNHNFNDHLRELSPAWGESGSGWNKTWHLKPYRDYAIRVTGEALFNINENFVQAWDKADGYGLANGAFAYGDKLEEERKSIKAKDLPKARGSTCRAQIVRTYPDKKDATILKAYTLASSNAVNYIYVENQYFQLTDWPKMLKEIRAQYCQNMADAKASTDDIAPLHIIVVTPQPERDQMVPNTYDTLNQLNQAQNMSAYDKEVNDQRAYDKKAQNQGYMSKVGTIYVVGMAALITGKAGKLISSMADQAAKTDVKRDSINSAPADPAGELNAMGVKTLAVMLMTYDAADEAKYFHIEHRDSNAQTAQAKKEEEANAKAKINKGKANDVDPEDLSNSNIRPKRYREIYIHSKLMFVDDVYTTLGSANLNARSMVGDSEFNICTDHYPFTKAARKRVWGNLAGSDLDGKECTRVDMADTFEKWGKRMLINKNRRKEGVAPVSESFIHPFEDPRDTPTVRLV
jgi:phosphatidylserine/phosphatidylglycerophosphate/cardiolipin synthase-like enzyme